MPRPIKIKEPTGPDEADPSVRIQFRGKEQLGYFKFRAIALDVFETNATDLARQLVLDFAALYDSRRKGGPESIQGVMDMWKLSVLENKKKKGRV